MKPILAAFAIAGLGIVISVNGDLAAETRSVEKELSNLNKIKFNRWSLSKWHFGHCNQYPGWGMDRAHGCGQRKF